MPPVPAFRVQKDFFQRSGVQARLPEVDSQQTPEQQASTGQASLSEHTTLRFHPLQLFFLKPYLGNSTSWFVWLNVAWYVKHYRILFLRLETRCSNPLRQCFPSTHHYGGTPYGLLGVATQTPAFVCF